MDSGPVEGLASTFRPQHEQQAATPSHNRNLSKENTNPKRRCVSTACIACRRRKSKCDGNLPKCAACASVYLTECEYAPHTDHRRKGVYKKEADSLKTKSATLQVLIQALLNYEEEDAIDLLKQMRTTDNLEELVQTVEAKKKGIAHDSLESPIYTEYTKMAKFDAELSGKMGDLLLEGSVKFIGATSNLVWLDDPILPTSPAVDESNVVRPREEAILSWTTVHKDKDLILHFLNMYFCWHYPYFTTLSKELFYRDFLTGTSSQNCSAILVNAMLALGCHFSTKSAARANPEDTSTTGDHYFAEAKRLLYENEEFANTKLCTVQALALMSVREAGCGRESKGWVYSGMSFRMASDLGLNVDAPAMNDASRLADEDIDARRITFWGCFLFDKQPQLQLSHTNTKKFDVFPHEDSEMWSPYTDAGIVNANAQPARTRTVALQISKLAEISSDLLTSFYQPGLLEKPLSKHSELKKLTDIHTRLEAWKTDLPAELEAREGQLPSVLLMHMFFQLLYIHLYRPFLRFTKSTSPLPAHVSPRKYCTQAASAISKLLRLYKRTHGLRQVINKVVYIAHSACTIHLLNLPDKNAQRDIVHGIKQLEEIGDCWTAARRTIKILELCAEKWQIDLPDEALASLARTRVRWETPEPIILPVSPNTFTSTAPHFTALPVAEVMAQTVHQQQQQRQQNHPLHPLSSPAFSTDILGPSQPATASPGEAFNLTPSPPGHPPPVQAILEPSRMNHLRQTTQLTREQQVAWNNLQARMNGAQRQQPTESNISAASLFGGVESLIGENQEWWFNDQSQLAQGFDNWNGPEPEWHSMQNNTENGSHTGSPGLSALPAVGTNGLFQPPTSSDVKPGSSQRNDIPSLQVRMSLSPDSHIMPDMAQPPLPAFQPVHQINHHKRAMDWSNRDYY